MTDITKLSRFATRDRFELYGGMSDIKFGFQNLVDLIQDGFHFVDLLVVYQGMSAECVNVGTNAPDMQFVDALNSGQITAAAIDVLPKEPPVGGDPLLDYDGDNLIVTPHIAWATDEARQNAIDELAANTRAFLEGIDRNRIV